MRGRGRIGGRVVGSCQGRACSGVPDSGASRVMEDVGPNAVGYPRGERLGGIVCKMCVARGGFHLVVTEKLPDHRQALDMREGAGREQEWRRS